MTFHDIRADGVDVSLRDVRKWFGEYLAVRDVSLRIEAGEMVCFLGPSGCGKTTTLRMIAGLETPDEGTITIGETAVNDIPTWKRNLGMVFQNYALFPHMSVFENVAFGLTMRRVGRPEIARRVKAALDLVRMADFAERMPSQLSGGQRQRIALARALVTRPRVLLLDEPLAALDKKLREQMQFEIRQLQRQVGITTIFVTHDQEEALTLSDRIVVMEQGRVVQTGTPSEIYERPGSRFVSDFIGLASALKGKVASAGPDGVAVDVEGVGRLVVETASSFAAGQAVEIVVRPEKVGLLPAAGAPASHLRGRVSNLVYTGAVIYCHVDIGRDDKVVAMIANEALARHAGQLGVGAEVALHWRSQDAHIFAV